MTTQAPLLPAGVTVFERGWLSSNNVLICGQAGCALVDSGYSTHSAQTLALLASALDGRALDLLLNTHLHSDHCGGNAALQQAYPHLQTRIPPGHAAFVQDWSPDALTYTPTGQTCPPFRFDAVLQPGTDIRLGDTLWQVHAAPGHDPHSVILFEPASRLMISADALWERGFGVIFPELEGLDAFDTVADTLDLIEALSPAMVIPGHGRVFTDLAPSLAFARARLRGFQADPAKHIQHAAKVLLKFKLLETQSQTLESFLAWAQATPYFVQIHQAHFAQTDFSQWANGLILDLVRVGAARREGLMVHNAG
ncbi:MAG: MBL fold metallo-hydrolase [Rhodoferax sp.]|nr:MBL fold metallo-hydrolase [Rhodoferax sp.]